MRVLATSIVMGSLVLIGAMPEAAGQSISSNTTIRLADGSRPPDERSAYIQKMETDMQAWQQKLHDFGDRVAVEEQKAGTAAETELNAAWTETEVDAHRLQTAGTAGWDSAKVSYENASRGLAAAWARTGHADK